MSDRMATDILIGGRIPRALAGALATVIQEEGVALDDDAPAFLPHTADDLLTAVHHGHLALADPARAWGQFDLLEEFLITHRIPFTRYTAGTSDYPPVAVSVRHGMTRPITFLTTPERGIVIAASGLTPLITALQRAGAASTPETVRRHLIATVVRRLRRAAGHTIPALPPFTFV